MVKTYVITEIISGKEQVFLKNVSDSGAEWVVNIDDALKFTNIEDVETEKELVINSLMTKNKESEFVKIIEL